MKDDRPYIVLASGSIFTVIFVLAVMIKYAFFAPSIPIRERKFTRPHKPEREYFYTNPERFEEFEEALNITLPHHPESGDNIEPALTDNLEAILKKIKGEQDEFFKYDLEEERRKEQERFYKDLTPYDDIVSATTVEE